MGSELRVAVPQRFQSGRIGSLVIIVLRCVALTIPRRQWTRRVVFKPSSVRSTLAESAGEAPRSGSWRVRENQSGRPIVADLVAVAYRGSLNMGGYPSSECSVR